MIKEYIQDSVLNSVLYSVFEVGVILAPACKVAPSRKPSVPRELVDAVEESFNVILLEKNQFDKLERNFLASTSYKPFVWWRFIDDIFAIWNWGVERLHEL